MPALLFVALLLIVGGIGFLIIRSMFYSPKPIGCLAFFVVIILVILAVGLIPGTFTIWAFEGTDANPSGQFIETTEHVGGTTGGTLLFVSNVYVIRVSDDLISKDILKYWADYKSGMDVPTKHFNHIPNQCYEAVQEREYAAKSMAEMNTFYPDPDYPGYVCATSVTMSVPYHGWYGDPRYISIRKIYTSGDEHLMFMFMNGEVAVDER